MKYLFLFFIFFSIYSYSDDPFQGGVGSFIDPENNPWDVFDENPATMTSEQWEAYKFGRKSG